MNLTSRTAGPNPMARLRSSVVVFCLLLLTALRLPAESYYLTPGRPDGIALLTPPPVPGSAEAAADLASARAVFDGRTPAEKTRAFKDASLSLFLFEPAIGPFFKAGRLPKTEALFQKVKTDMAQAINTPKEHWKRQRPYQLDAHLSLGAPEKSFGYPSGHSTRGTVYALLMAEVFPEKKEAILAIGREIGWDRVLIGKHFPTDIYAGRVLGQAIIRELLSSPAFQRDLAEAKAEAEAVQHQEVAPNTDPNPDTPTADSPADKPSRERAVVGQGSN
jgi:acid phosphatase (class A)